MRAEGSQHPSAFEHLSFTIRSLNAMSPSYKLIASTLIFLLAACGAASGVYAQELKTEVVPGGSARQTTPRSNAQPPQKVEQSSVSLEKDSASSVGHHHYNSSAERAQDDLLITE